MDAFNRYIQAIDDQHRTDYKVGSAEYFTDRMIQVCQDNQGIVYLACDQDEKMEAVSAAPGVIDELFVSEPYRGQHIGKQLLESIEMYLRNKGCTMVRLPVFAPNILAHNFYQRAGYVERLIIMMKPLN